MRHLLSSALLVLGTAVCANAQTVNPIGTGCMGSNGVPNLTANHGPTPGQSVTLSLSNLPLAGGFNWWVWSTTDDFWGGQLLPVELDFVGAPGCFIWITPYYTTFAPQPPAANVDLTFDVPNASFLYGCRFLSQVLVCDFPVNQLGYTVSNGLELLFAP